ncbi:MAG: hypothetical protein M1820_003867 [Bogoriella megaspora]|nr:MAG: hypothetical protein M1820_003867 [Bogoriella megaspora]
MVGRTINNAFAAGLLAASGASAFMGASLKSQLLPRQLPKGITNVTTISSPTGVTIRYKEPGNAGVCETTPGVKSYSGYIDIAPNSSTFFWFFESRRDPANDPLTLWLNGGPGSDSLIGLFQELGPCNVTEDLVTQVNPYSWNEVSNLLFLSQPVGTGFSYSEEEVGSFNNYTGAFENDTLGSDYGRYPVIDPTVLDTTDLAAVAAYHILQGFVDALPQLDNGVKSKEFNLWTESYGGHYGPAFFNYFYDQNQAIANGSASGVELNFNTLGLGNAIIDEYIQAPYYPEFAVNNTYGIKAYNDTVYNYARFATYMPSGCLSQVAACRQVDKSTLSGQAVCTEAADMCRDNVEGVYYSFGGRGVYDIRHPYDDPTPPELFPDYLNQAHVQDALGVDLNYTESNNDIYWAFQQTGDFVYNNFIEDLEHILANGVRVNLYYGDADYICNWFGGEAVSLAVQYAHSKEFAAAGYAPFVVGGVEVGEVRQYGNFSFTRIYEAGHEVPFYQPSASLQLFNRTLYAFDIATGEKKVTADLSTTGQANATHTEPYVPLPTTTSSASTSASPTTAVPIYW